MGNNQTLDKRNQRSRAALRRALVELMKQKQLNQISIKELCQTAGVNRSTFYGSYDDLDQLLWELHGEVFRQMTRQLGSSYEDIWATEPEKSIRGFTEIAEYMKAHRELFLLFLQNNDDQMFESNMMRFYGARYDKMLQDRRARYVFMYNAIGSFTVLCAWLLENCPLPSAQIAEVVYKMSYTARTMLQPPGNAREK